MIDSLVFMVKSNTVNSLLDEGNTLDVGCGDKRYTNLIPDAIGVDSNLEFEGVVNSPDYFMSATKLDFPDGEFSNICYLDVLEHIPEVEKAISEASRVLKLNGTLVIIDPNDGWLKIFRFLSLRFKDAIRGNPDHVHKFNKDSLVDLLSPLFKLERCTNKVIFTGYRFRRVE